MCVYFSGSIWVSWYQKGKTSLDLNEARDDEVLGWQWHQQTNMQTICTLLRQITIPTPHHSIFTGQMLFLTPNQQHQSTEGYWMLWITTTITSTVTCSIGCVQLAQRLNASIVWGVLSTFPIKCHFPLGDLDHPQIHGSLGPCESTSQTGSIVVQPFCRAQGDVQHIHHAAISSNSSHPWYACNMDLKWYIRTTTKLTTTSPGFTSAGDTFLATLSGTPLPPITSTQLDGKKPTCAFVTNRYSQWMCIRIPSPDIPPLSNGYVNYGQANIALLDTGSIYPVQKIKNRIWVLGT